MTLNTTFSLYIPLLVWTVVIYFLSAIPARNIDTSIPDYVVHIIEYGVLSVLIYRVVGFYRKGSIQSLFISFILTFVYAITDEFHQYFVPGRTPSFRDLGFDALGALLTLIVIWVLIPKLPEKLLVIAKKLHFHHEVVH